MKTCFLELTHVYHGYIHFLFFFKGDRFCYERCFFRVLMFAPVLTYLIEEGAGLDVNAQRAPGGLFSLDAWHKRPP